MKTLCFINQTKATGIGDKITVAETFLSRLVGLMGRRSLGDGSGLWITPSSGVHTCWMRMAIDVVGLDRGLRVVKTGQRVKPWRVSALSLKTHSVLELPPGQIANSRIEVGDQLQVVPASS